MSQGPRRHGSWLWRAGAGALLAGVALGCGLREPGRTPDTSRQEPAVAGQPPPDRVEYLGEIAERVPLWLPNFYAALNELASGQRGDHVRVLWFGDSHTASEYWTQAVRHSLQEQFGGGGAGVVLLGLKRYRHSQASVSRRGTWRTLPASPASTKQRSRHLGLAGQVSIPTSRNASVRIKLRQNLPWTRGPLIWELLYRLPRPSSAFSVVHGDKTFRVGAGTGEERASGISSVRLRTRETPQLRLTRFRGRPELFGVIVEAEEQRGLVLDSLGIDGARIGTPLAWLAEPWIQEVRARQPELVVLAYGTNEVVDETPVSSYEGQYAKVVARLRSAVPEADCLLIGPTDRAKANWRSHPRVLAIDLAQRQIAENLGCAYFSALEAMGGPGALRLWAYESPPRARRDRVRLLPRGYEKLGALLVEQLLESYRERYTAARAAAQRADG